MRGLQCPASEVQCCSASMYFVNCFSDTDSIWRGYGSNTKFVSAAVYDIRLTVFSGPQRID